MEEDKKQALIWTAPDCPVRVSILADVMNEVRILAVEAFYSVPRGGVEIGGAFFGTRQDGKIQILAHRQIRCEYSTGPSFTLSVKDQLGLSGLLDQAPEDPDLHGMLPLGWYHSHTRSEIFLSPADLQLYNEFFPERHQIALVMRPANLQPTRGGFFFRDYRGNVKSDSSVQEFKLEPPDFGLAALDSPVPAPVLPEQPEPLIAAAGPAEKPEPEPVATAEEHLPVAKSVAAVVAAAAAAASSAPSAPVVAPKPVAEEPLPLQVVPKPVDPGLRSFNLAETSAQKSVHKRKGSGWIWAVLLFILLAAGSVAFLKWGRFSPPVSLGLETYDVNGAFLIRWDRSSAAIRQAGRATLEIEDGGEKADPISLTPEELSVGGYPYMRRTPQVSVRMRVEGPLPSEEITNFVPAQALGAQTAQSAQPSPLLAQALQEKQHLTTELINESMETSELRREITSLRRQLAEERARNSSPNR